MDRLSKGLRFLSGVLAFALVGPPVGGIVAWLGMGASAMRSPLPFIAGSWFEGGLLALGTGVLTGAAALRGMTSWMVPVTAAVLASAAVAVATAGPDWPAVLRVARVFMPASTAAAVVCWLLTRSVFVRKPHDLPR